MRALPIVCCLCALLSGCATSPSISVLGAYFPDWLFCMAGAMFATALIHAGLRASGRLKQPERPGSLTLPLAYFALTVILALTGWLLFFQN